MNWKLDREFFIIYVFYLCILLGENFFFIYFRLKIDM